MGMHAGGQGCSPASLFLLPLVRPGCCCHCCCSRGHHVLVTAAAIAVAAAVTVTAITRLTIAAGDGMSWSARMGRNHASQKLQLGPHARDAQLDRVDEGNDHGRKHSSVLGGADNGLDGQACVSAALEEALEDLCVLGVVRHVHIRAPTGAILVAVSRLVLGLAGSVCVGVDIGIGARGSGV